VFNNFSQKSCMDVMEFLDFRFYKSLEPTKIADAEHYAVVMQSTEIICHRILDDNIVEVTRILFAIANALLNLDAAYKLYP